MCDATKLPLEYKDYNIYIYKHGYLKYTWGFSRTAAMFSGEDREEESVKEAFLAAKFYIDNFLLFPLYSGHNLIKS